MACSAPSTASTRSSSKASRPTQIRGYVIESLLARGYDEPFTLYGLLARTVETDAERSYVTFELDPAAKFSDGKPVTAADVIFSWQLLRDKGRPNYRTYYAKVAKAEALSERAVRFDLTGADDRELPLILGLMPVLAKHAIDPDTFEDTTFEPIVGSGPYVIAKVDAGRQRHAQARSELLGTRSRRSIAASGISTRSASISTATPTRISRRSRKAFTTCAPRTIRAAGRPPTTCPRCATAASSRSHFPTGMPKILSGLVFNTRRPIFADIRVREAIGLLFDFEWVNHNFFFDRYERTASYFEGSELSARGRPADARERALLAPFPDAVRAGRDGRHLAPPVTDGSGRDRETLKRALELLDAAGYELVGTVLRAQADQDSRSPSNSWSPPRSRSGSRSPSRATSSAPASRCACAWSTPCNTTGGASPTIST